MTAFVKRVGEARKGIGPLVSSLRKYDEELLTNIKNSSGQEQALDILANAIQKAGNAADRAALANAAFGRSGVHMSNLLKQGAKGIDAVTDRARELGLVLSNESVANAEVLKDRMTELGKVLSTKVTKAIVDNAKSITTLTEAAIRAVGMIGKLVQGFQDLKNFGAFLFQEGAVNKLNSKIEASQRRLEVANRLFIKKQRFFETDSRKERQKGELEAEVKILNNLHQQLAVQDKLRTSVLLRKDAIDEVASSTSVGGGGGGGESSNIFLLADKMKESEAKRLEVLQQSLLSEKDLIQEALLDKTFIIENSFQSELINAETRASLLTKIEKIASDDRLVIAKNEAEEKRSLVNDKFNTAKNIAGRLSSLAKTEGGKETQRSRTLAKIGIGISTAQAIMNALAVTPFPLGLGMAAIAAAEGAKQLSKVGGGGGGSTPSAASVSAVDLSQAEPVTSGPVAAKSATQIIFTGDMLGEDLSERLIDIIRTATNDRDIVVFDGDSRQAQEIREAS